MRWVRTSGSCLASPLHTPLRGTLSPFPLDGAGQGTVAHQESAEMSSEVGDVQIKLLALWIALMLTYLLGDVLRIFSGDFIAGEIGGTKITQPVWLGIAILMVIPIVMAVLSVTLLQPAVRWAHILAAASLFVFNLIGLPTYPSAYDKFLIVVGLVINGLTVWTAWNWI